MQAARLATRLQREIRMLQADPPPGVCAWPCNDGLTHLEAQVEGPEETVYAKGIFKLDVHVPERYPFEPPNVKFKTPVYHPNIDNGGRICLDILNMPPKGAWKPSLNIPTILASIGLLLAEPNPDDGLMGEITAEYKYDRESFDSKARKWTEQYAVQNQVKDGMPEIQNSMMTESVGQSAVTGKIDKRSSPERDLSRSEKDSEDTSHGCNGSLSTSAGKVQQTATGLGLGRVPASNSKLNLGAKLSLGKGGRGLEKDSADPKTLPSNPARNSNSRLTTRQEVSAVSNPSCDKTISECNPSCQQRHSDVSSSAPPPANVSETDSGAAATMGSRETISGGRVSDEKGASQPAPQSSKAAITKASVDFSKLRKPKGTPARVQSGDSAEERTSTSQDFPSASSAERPSQTDVPKMISSRGTQEGSRSSEQPSLGSKPRSSEPQTPAAQVQAQTQFDRVQKRPRDTTDSTSVSEARADTHRHNSVSAGRDRPFKSMKADCAQVVSKQPSEGATHLSQQGLPRGETGKQNLSKGSGAVEVKTNVAPKGKENVLIATREGIIMNEQFLDQQRVGDHEKNGSNQPKTKVAASFSNDRNVERSNEATGAKGITSSKASAAPEPVSRMPTPINGKAVPAAQSSVKPLKAISTLQNLQNPPAGVPTKHSKVSKNVDTSEFIVLDSESDEEVPPSRARSRLSLANRKGMKRK